MVDLIALRFRLRLHPACKPIETGRHATLDSLLGWLLVLMLVSPLVAHGASGSITKEKEGAGSASETSGLRVKVEIEGVEGVLLDNVHGHLSLFRERRNPRLTIHWLKRLHSKAEREIRQALEPFGFYHARVSGELLQKPDGSWLARYRVTPGPRVEVVSADLRLLGEGSQEPRLLHALKQFPLQPGDFLDHGDWERGKADLLELAHDLGYLKARMVVSRILVDPVTNQARLRLQLDTGSRYRFGELQLKQEILDPDFVKRYLADLVPGEPYSQPRLASVQAGLVESGYFSLVDVNPRLDQVKGDQVPVEVVLQPAARQSFSIGLGYDTDIGFNLNGRWLHRRINRRGHKADANLRLSIRESYLRGNYWIPIQDPRTTKLGFTFALEADNTDTGERRTIDLEAGYYLLWRDWITRLFLQLKHERFLSGSEGRRNTTLFSLGGRAERVAFEEAAFPRHGWSLAADLRASPGLLSSTAYLRGWSQGRLLLPLGEKGRFYLRGELGFALVEDFDRYPNSLRFFAGGDNSVRGWAWKELGPKDEQGEVIGGKEVITFTVEYDHRVAEKWVAAGFLDGGNAFDNRLDKLYYGAGFGARWLSPVGAVKLDLAWPFNKHEGDTRVQDVRVHFGFEVTL